MQEVAKVAKSPHRGSFQMEPYEKQLEDDPDNESAQKMLEMYLHWSREADVRTLNENWQKNNLEYDMRTCEWMCAKAKASNVYAQNIYAALCNRDFQKLDVLPILKDETWSCSWRHAGGIVADMREEGDYIDWYCSGIGDGLGNGGHEGYMAEAVVTEEIENDLKKLGWIVIPEEKN